MLTKTIFFIKCQCEKKKILTINNEFCKLFNALLKMEQVMCDVYCLHREHLE